MKPIMFFDLRGAAWYHRHFRSCGDLIIQTQEHSQVLERDMKVFNFAQAAIRKRQREYRLGQWVQSMLWKTELSKGEL